MSPASGITHDCTITPSGGSVTGLMLWRDQRGLRSYGVQHAQTLTPGFRTQEELTQAGFPPEIAFPQSEEDWHNGMGGANHRKHPLQVAYTKKMEGTAGKLRLAPELRVAVNSAVPTYYKPSGFAVVGTEVWSFQGDKVYFQDSSWTTGLTAGTTPKPLQVLYRNGIEFSGNAYACCWAQVATASVTGWSAGLNDLSFVIDDPFWYIYKPDSDADWTHLAGTLSTVQTKLVPKYMAKVRNALGNEIVVGGYFGSVAVAAFSTAATLSEELPASEAPGTWRTVNSNDGMSVGDCLVVENELLRIAYVDSPLERIAFDTRGNFGTTAAVHANGTALRKLTYSKSVHTIRTTTNPTDNTLWSAAISIGQSDSQITALVTVEDGAVLYICKTNGIWTYEGRSGVVTNLAPDFTAQIHPDNFRGAIHWGDRVLLPLGAGGMMQIRDGSTELEDVSFETAAAPDETWLHGRVLALTSTPTAVFALVQDADTLEAHLLMGELVPAYTEDGQDIAWWQMGHIKYATSSVEEHWTLFAEGVPSGSNIHRRIWVGVESSGSNLLPYFLPLETDISEGYTDDGAIAARASGAVIAEGATFTAADTTLTVDSGTLFEVNHVLDIEGERMTVSAISGNDLTVQRGMLGGDAAETHADGTAISIRDFPEVALTELDWNQPQENKTFASIDFTTANLGAGGRQFTVLYRVDAGAWKKDLTDSAGNADGVVDTSPSQTLTFPSATTGKVLELRIFPALTTVGTTGPELSYFRANAQIRPGAVISIVGDFYLADDMLLLNGARGGQPKADLANLRTWAAQAAEVEFTDAEGTARQMVISPGTLSVQQVAHEANRRPEWRVRMLMLAV